MEKSTIIYSFTLINYYYLNDRYMHTLSKEIGWGFLHRKVKEQRMDTI